MYIFVDDLIFICCCFAFCNAVSLLPKMVMMMLLATAVRFVGVAATTIGEQMASNANYYNSIVSRLPFF